MEQPVFSPVPKWMAHEASRQPHPLIRIPVGTRFVYAILTRGCRLVHGPGLAPLAVTGPSEFPDWEGVVEVDPQTLEPWPPPPPADPPSASAR